MFHIPEAETAAVTLIKEFLDKEVQPVAQKLEHDDQYPYALVERMKEMGFFGFILPEKYGGLALSAVAYAQIVEQISQVWMSVSGIINSHLIMAHIVDRFGTLTQQEHFLPRMASGEWRGGLCLTEPDAGSDVAAVSTTAVRKGDQYLINGRKMFITNGRTGNTFALLARTDKKADPPHKGLSIFIVQKGGPGFEVTRDLEKLGYKGLDTCEILFENFAVPAANLVGEVEGKGFAHVMGGLEMGRINVAARGVGLAQAALDAAVRYSQQRVAFGKPICQHQSIQIKLAEMATKVEAARLLTQKAAQMKDRGERCDFEAGMAKLFATETSMEAAAESMRIHGGYGYTKEFIVERLYRDAPLLVIGEGTNEIQRILIARQLIARNPI